MKSKLSNIGSKIMGTLMDILLPLFYLFCFICIIGGGLYYYNKQIEQQQMILDIEKRITMSQPGTAISLPVKKELEASKLNYTVQDDDIAVVQDDGTLVGVDEGSTTVTIETEDKSKSQTIVVSVGKDAIDETEDKGVINDMITDGKIENNEIKPEGLELNTQEISLEYGDTYTPVADIMPRKISNRKLNWVSSNPDLVSVDSNGLIRILKNANGIAIISASLFNNLYTAFIKIFVKQKIYPATEIKLNKNNVDMKYNESVNLEATVLPDNASNKEVNWASSNPNLVSVDQSGKVVAIANEDGTATVTATNTDGKVSASSTVNVEKVETVIPANGIKINKTSLKLAYGQSFNLSAEVTPSNASNKKVVWSSSNAGLVSVDQTGKIAVVANQNGTATITAATEDGKYSKKVTVTTTRVAVIPTNVNLNVTKITLNSNASYRFTATVLPADADNKRVTWKSSNNKILTVDQNGNITINKNQDAKVVVTATTKSGNVSASVEITIKKVDVPVTGISVDKANISVKYGTTAKITTTVYPAEATNKNVIYKSSNAKKVSVNKNGVVKAISNYSGTVKVTVTTRDGNYKRVVKVRIIEDESKIVRKATGFWWPIAPEHKSLAYLNTGRLYASSHRGVDISAHSGDSKGKINVIASYDGVVEYAYNDIPPKYDNYYGKSGATASWMHDGFGNCIKIRHTYNGKTIYTYYAHLTQNIKVKAGDKVVAGQVIATMGSSGNSTGTHLHFETRVGSGSRDYTSKNNPLNYISPNSYPSKRIK